MSTNESPMFSSATLRQLGVTADQVGVVVVDHGSRRAESNQLLEAVVAQFRETIGWPIVEPAHMELAEPSIETAFGRAVQQGARLVVGHPYFLAPGRHWRDDLPALFRAAAALHPGVRHCLTAPLGPHPLMQQIMVDRVVHCLQHVAGEGPDCSVCHEDSSGCSLS